MYGGGSGTMTLDELHSLEKYLEIWMYHIRSAKVIVSWNTTLYYSRENESCLILYNNVADGYHVSRDPAAEE